MTDLATMSDHDLLSLLGLTWLFNLGCAVALNEIQLGGVGIADAVGFGITKGNQRGVLIESKVSRSDFLRDQKKWHRRHYSDASMGISDRYYIAPVGMIRPEELPEGWGLLEPDAGRDAFFGTAHIVKRARYDTPNAGWWAHHFATVARITNMRLIQDRYFDGAYPPASRITIPGMPDELARRLAPLSHTTTSFPPRSEIFEEVSHG